jgi:hypothetical protein
MHFKKKHNLFFITLAIFLLGCGESYYTTEDFLKVKKIDTHVHLNSESTSLTKQAENDNFTLLTVNVDAPSYVSLDDQERFALHQIQQSKNVQYLSAFPIKDWDSANWQVESIMRLKNSFSNGALGVKLWKNVGMEARDSSGNLIMVDDPKFDPVIQFVIDNHKTILGHLGEPKNCWLPIDQMTVNNDKEYFKDHPQYHMHLHPEMPTYQQQIQARDHFLERHPDLKFVGAHLGSLEWSVDELAKRLDKFPNMAVDMAARIAHLQHQSISDYDKVRNFIIRYQDRLIYATDSGINMKSDPEQTKKHVHETWMNDWKYFVTNETMTSAIVNGEFKGLKLPRKIIDKIYRENAVKWFSMKEAN